MLFSLLNESQLQTIAIFIHTYVVTFERVVTGFILLPYLLIYGKWMRILIFAYVIFVLWDWKTPYRGGRRCRLWRWYATYLQNYFPIKLVQNAELSPENNYLLVLHPHSVLFLACHIGFGLDAFNLESKGLRGLVATINVNFIFPWAREYFLSSGAISASEDSIKECLLDPRGGNLTALLPGGAAEASHANPGVYKIILRNRRGFCRIAIETGAPLVPTFVFGEVDAYYVTPRDDSSWVRLLKHIAGFNYVSFSSTPKGMSIMPRRVPITVVMGEPIPVQKVESPSKQEIEDLHAKYVDAVIYLYNTEKYNYLKEPFPELAIV